MGTCIKGVQIDRSILQRPWDRTKKYQKPSKNYALPISLDNNADDFTDVECNNDVSTIGSKNYNDDDATIRDASERLKSNPIIFELSLEKYVGKRLKMLSIVHNVVSLTKQENDKIQIITMESGINRGDEYGKTSLLLT